MASSEQRLTKRIHLVRHGEGLHNVFRRTAHEAGRVPKAKRGNVEEVSQDLHDPYLTEKGQAEARQARELAKAFQPQLLVTSPLRRAVQTCLSVFKDAVDSKVPIIAHELCREQFHTLDPSIWDSRRGRSLLANEFPGIDFMSYVLPEDTCSESSPKPSGEATGPGPRLHEDPMWWHCGSPYGTCESGTHEASMVEHAYGFLCWLMSRPEHEIGVATHSLWLLALYYGALDRPVSKDGSLPPPDVFHTGELRTLLIEELPAPRACGSQLSVSKYASALLLDGIGRTSDDPLFGA
eukprot:TRINITY_DN10789_c0_g1_i1.p1 TRINITY_DN10789_c0_g1~~TRINITY_DN10789_c0_g1_i1.p1  ORF type:complete len:294 (+),score=32.89 TRINITY_DN10789_c0_g1_i1:169-1050(+)